MIIIRPLSVLCVGLLFGSLFATEASAISRYNSTSYTCQAVKQLIAREGAIILRYPSRRSQSLTLHDRFVKNASRCQLDEYAARKSVPTADTNSCKLRYCKVKEVNAAR